MAIFKVIVGNIGTVHNGNNYMKAASAFTTYKKQSAAGYGRAAGEPVTLFHHGEIKMEYEPPKGGSPFNNTKLWLR